MPWLACGEHEVPADLSWLSARERARLAEIRFTKRRDEFLLRRWAGKRAVAGLLGPEPVRLATIEVLNRPSGAPYVEIDCRPGGMEVSLTDRAGWAVGLVGPPAAGALGVDLELVEPRTGRFVADVLTGPEAAYVRARRRTHGEDGWNAAANLVWSAKEATLKVLGVGLRADTRSVEVRVTHEVRPDGWAPLEVTSTGGDAFSGWWRRDGAFVLTVVQAEPAAPPDPVAAGADLAAAEPVHSWLAGPTVDSASPAPLRAGRGTSPSRAPAPR